MTPIQKAHEDKRFQFFLARICGQYVVREADGLRIEAVVFRGKAYILNSTLLPSPPSGQNNQNF